MRPDVDEPVIFARFGVGLDAVMNRNRQAKA
jgi:hypothetical protein